MLGSIELLSVSEIEQCRQKETILFSGILQQNFSLSAKVTEIRVSELQLDLRLTSRPGQGFSAIEDLLDRTNVAYKHYRVETNQIFPDFQAKVRDTRTNFLLIIYAQTLLTH